MTWRKARRAFRWRAEKPSRPDKVGAETDDQFRFLKSYVAFNADQIENLPSNFYPQPVTTAPMSIAAYEAWFAKLEITRILTRDVACYIPSRDTIGMPPPGAFEPVDWLLATSPVPSSADMVPEVADVAA